MTTFEDRRVLFVLHDLDNRGGTEEHTRRLSKGLHERGWLTWMVAPTDKGLLLRSSLGTEELIPAPVVSPLETPYRVPEVEEAFSTILSAVQPSIVHIQHFFKWPLGMLDQVLQYASRRAILTLHDYYVVSPDFTLQEVIEPQEVITSSYAVRRFGHDISAYLNRRLEILQRSLSRFSTLIAPSSFLPQFLKEILPFSFHIIEHGIPSREVSSVRLDTPGELVFGYVGSLVPQKGYKVLFEAFKKLTKKSFSVTPRLRVFGWGEGFSAEGFGGIEFFGPYAPEQLPSILPQFQVGILPSLFRETYSLVLSELWAAQKPVIASTIGALGERVIHLNNGYLVPPGESDALVEALEWFLQEQSWKEWSLPVPRQEEAMLDDYERLYTRLMSSAY